MTAPEYNLARCSMCRKVVLNDDLYPGYRCKGPDCAGYLIVVTKGQKRGQLKWHQPLECEELEGDCAPCNVYVKAAA